MTEINIKLTPNRKEELALEEIRKAIRNIQFGSINIIIQDGVVIQIERNTKSRIDYSVLDKVSGGEGI